MAFSEIHHVALAVGDMERSIAFYRDILGFRIYSRTPDGQMIELIQLPSADEIQRARS